jgi:hypothetical protein
VIFGIGSNFKILIIMVWGILYFICTVICCGIILYVNDLTFDDDDAPLLVVSSIAWPILLLFIIIYGLGYCVRFLLTKIIKTK